MRSEPFKDGRTAHPANSGIGRVSRRLVPSLVLVKLLCPLLCLVVLLPVSCSRKKLAPSGEASEVLRQNLVQREGRFFLTESTDPFTGLMVEQYADGTRKSCSAISNGLLHGSSEGYYTNGQPQVREYFQAGVSHGVRTKWHPNGQKLSEVAIVGGQLEGPFRRWHENGALAEEMEMSHSQPEGLSRAYFPSGAVKAEARLHQGRLQEQKFWKDRELFLTDQRSTSN